MKDITSLDWGFDTETKKKGYALYQKTIFNNIYKAKNKYTTTLEGNTVMLEFSDSKKDCLDDDNCSCNEYEENGECRHIYALICSIKKISKKLNVDFEKIDYERNKRKVTKVQLFPPKEYEIEESFKQQKKSFNSLGIVFKSIFNILLIPGKILLAFLGIIGGIDSEISSHKSSMSNDNLEKEMDAYGLEDWQKDLVRKGDYDPWNFEEENLEEDDYYYEDDK